MGCTAVCGAVRGLLAIGTTTGLPLLTATDISITAHRLKTSRISLPATALCEFFQDGYSAAHCVWMVAFQTVGQERVTIAATSCLAQFSLPS